MIFWDEKDGQVDTIFIQNIFSKSSKIQNGANKPYFDYILCHVENLRGRNRPITIPFVNIEFGENSISKKKRRIKYFSKSILFYSEVKNFLTAAEYDGINDDIWKFDRSRIGSLQKKGLSQK